MHAFWTVLLIPLCVIAARLTNRLVKQRELNLAHGSAAGIWRIFAVLATALLVLFLTIDVVAWAMELPGAPWRSSQTVSEADSLLFNILMRAVFRGLTATNFPILQIWIGAIVGLVVVHQEAKSKPSQSGEASLV